MSPSHTVELPLGVLQSVKPDTGSEVIKPPLTSPATFTCTQLAVPMHELGLAVCRPLLGPPHAFRSISPDKTNANTGTRKDRFRDEQFSRKE